MDATGRRCTCSVILLVQLLQLLVGATLVAVLLGCGIREDALFDQHPHCPNATLPCAKSDWAVTAAMAPFLLALLALLLLLGPALCITAQAVCGRRRQATPTADEDGFAVSDRVDLCSCVVSTSLAALSALLSGLVAVPAWGLLLHWGAFVREARAVRALSLTLLLLFLPMSLCGAAAAWFLLLIKCDFTQYRRQKLGYFRRGRYSVVGGYRGLSARDEDGFREEELRKVEERIRRNEQ